MTRPKQTLAILLLLASTKTIIAQQLYDLQVPGTPNGPTSSAERTHNRLRIRTADQTFTYERDSRYDDPARRYIAYVNRQSGRIIRWPRSNSGAMQIGSVVRFGVPRFRSSQMLITAQPTPPLVLAPALAAVPVAGPLPYGYIPLSPVTPSGRFRNPVLGRANSRHFVPNPHLSAAAIEFTNTNNKDIWVLVGDKRNLLNSLRLKIKPGHSTTIKLDREAGGTWVEVQEVHRFWGVERRETTTPVLPRQLYDVSVYELIAASVSIDRTRSGNGHIEDITLAPSSIGFFNVPAGDSLPATYKLDTYAVAKRQNNTGGVRRIDMKNWLPSKYRNPVEDIIRNSLQQSTRR